MAPDLRSRTRGRWPAKINRMRTFAQAFDDEIAEPSLEVVTADKTAGAIGNFMTETRKAGPALAAIGAAPELIGAYKTHGAYGDVEKETPFEDETGAQISPDERRRAIKRRKKELAGATGEQLGSAAGSLAGWMVPVGAVATATGLPGLVIAGGAGVGASLLGRRAGRAIGEGMG